MIAFTPKNSDDFGRCVSCGRKLKDVYWDDPNQVYLTDGHLWMPSEIQRPLTSIAPLHRVGSECLRKIPVAYLWQFGLHWCDGHAAGECAACTT